MNKPESTATKRRPDGPYISGTGHLVYQDGNSAFVCECIKGDYAQRVVDLFANAPRSAVAEDKPPQVVGRVWRRPGMMTEAKLNSVGRELPDDAPLYAAPAVASTEAAFLRQLLEIIHPTAGVQEPMSAEQADAEQAIIDRIHAVECEISAPSDAGPSAVAAQEGETPRTDAFFNSRTVGESEFITYNTVAKGLLTLARQLERELALMSMRWQLQCDDAEAARLELAELKSARSATARTYLNGIEDAAAILKGSTFSADHIGIVDDCIAIVLDFHRKGGWSKYEKPNASDRTADTEQRDDALNQLSGPGIRKT